MRKHICSAAGLVLLLLLGIVIAGCGSTPLTPFTPTPPGPQPAKVPMGAFLESTGNPDLRAAYVATNDGSGLTQLNLSAGVYHSVYVVPDGSKGVVCTQKGWFSQIYSLTSLSATEPVQLTTTDIIKASPILSGDGSKIVYLQRNPFENTDYPKWDVAVMNSNGSNLNVIAAPGASSFAHPFFSPDGSKIVLAMGVAAFGADWYIHTMNADGTNLTRISPQGVPGETPAFSPTGDEVVFASTAMGDASIYIMNTDGSGLKRVGPQDSYWRDPLLVGDRIMFVSGGDIYSIKTDGSDKKQVTRTTSDDAFEIWP